MKKDYLITLTNKYAQYFLAVDKLDEDWLNTININYEYDGFILTTDIFSV